MRWEYSFRPIYPTRRFVCTSDLREFRELNQDTAATSVWYIPASAGANADSQASFDLLDFSVDGEACTIRRTAKAGSQTLWGSRTSSRGNHAAFWYSLISPPSTCLR